MTIPARTISALGLAAGWCAPALAPVVPPVAAALQVPLTLPDRDGVTLTFDDGPHRLGTTAILERLARTGTRAVFFLVGEHVLRDGPLAREIAERGHDIGIHGHEHRNLLRISPRGVRDDLDRAADAIASATGRVPQLYRPPYGILSAAALREVRRRGWTPLMWSRWGRDWEHGATAEGVAQRVLSGIGPGDVVLLHDADHYGPPGSWRTTAGALDLLLPALSARGLV